jgi:hypothetical protein
MSVIKHFSSPESETQFIVKGAGPRRAIRNGLWLVTKNPRSEGELEAAKEICALNDLSPQRYSKLPKIITFTETDAPVIMHGIAMYIEAVQSTTGLFADEANRLARKADLVADYITRTLLVIPDTLEVEGDV